MDIRIGSSQSIGSPKEKGPTATDGVVEARLLAIRSPRRRATPPAGSERRAEQPRQRDPLTARVLVLMIPDGSRLPEDLERGGWRVLLRFARR